MSRSVREGVWMGLCGAALAVFVGTLAWWAGWLGDGAAVVALPADTGQRSTTDQPAAPVVMPPPTDAVASAVSPAGLMADYRDSGGRSHAKHAGKRLSLQGAVVSVESGENGLVMVSLDAGPDLPPVRAVIADSDAARVRDWSAGRAVVLDCANQGLLMGEPLLADCRAVKD
ncbi:MAG: hypothetical protein WAQ08_04675 [Aquabacterium sp.]|uniref:OB-fold protein n=1 Tax=Aquabacterium sp. TaxID=1872578 RepID=UPI003BAEA3FA